MNVADTAGWATVNLLAGAANGLLSLAFWRLLLGLTKLAEPTKWAIWLSAGWLGLGTVNGLFSDDYSTVRMVIRLLAGCLALGLAWYLWVVRAKREGNYYG